MANGIIIIDKPSDWTSMDVCAKLRGVFKEKRIGHAGTLDPMATGMLPVFVGRATRAVEFASEGEKEYVAGLRLGTVTNTQDTSGEILTEHPVTVQKADVEAVLAHFRGDILQIPPMYSAIKIQGKKLYELARKGVEVERKPRPVTIHELELLEGEGCDYLLRVRCSKGTYIRTLCHDIGSMLGCGGTMSSLRRTMACGFDESDAVALDTVLKAEDATQFLRPIDQYFSDHPALTIDGRALFKAKNGNAFPCNAEEGTYRVYDPDGRFLLLGRCKDGMMTTTKSFFEV